MAQRAGEAKVFEFGYRVVGTGWSETPVVDDKNHAVLVASYLSDALGDLIEAVTVIAEGATAARCSYEDEPGEYRWIFERTGDQVDVTILGFEDVLSAAPDDRGVLLFQTTQPLLRLVRAVLSSAQQVVDDLGEDGYTRAWINHPFPATLTRLRRALRSRRDADAG